MALAVCRYDPDEIEEEQRERERRNKINKDFEAFVKRVSRPLCSYQAAPRCTLAIHAAAFAVLGGGAALLRRWGVFVPPAPSARSHPDW